MNNRRNRKERIPVRLSLTQMEDIVVSLINNPLNRKFINNVENLFMLIDDKSISNDLDKEVLVTLILRLTSTIGKINSTNKEMTLNYLDTSGRNEERLKEMLSVLSERTLPLPVEEELAEAVSRELQYGTVLMEGEKLQDLLANFSAGNYNNFDTFMSGFSESLTTFNRQLIKAQDSGNNTKEDISLNDPNVLGFVDSVIKHESSDTSRIKTGIKLINESLDGGWQNGRLYVALGLAKGWKSSFLLNAVIWAKKYNKLETKDPTKKPVIVYLTMENTTRETMLRLWAYAKGNNDRIESNDADYVMKVFQEENIITPDDNSPEIVIWSRPNKSITTADFDIMIDDLAKEGKEAVFIIQDYMKRIRSVQTHKELRFELGAITDEFVNIARSKDVPFLTAMQLNRDAYRDISESSTLEQQINSISRIGSHNVGESIDIVHNCDFAFILGRAEAPIYDGDQMIGNDRFLVFKNLISRNNTPKHTMFIHRFKDGYNLRLEEDILSKESKSIIYDGSGNAMSRLNQAKNNGNGESYQTSRRSFTR